MSKFFQTLFEIICWILIFISPLLILFIIAAIIYFNNTANQWLPITIISIGVILGILFAERIRRKYGTTNFMGSLHGGELEEKRE
jgi:hypothetical protein